VDLRSGVERTNYY